MLQKLIVKGSIIILVIITLTILNAKGHPLDLYDDVSDLFQAMTLDEVPGAHDTDANAHDAEKDPKEYCRMPARKGVCRALIPRWSYDADKKDCVEFKFGGCDGNDNNFSNYKECMNKCKDV